MHKIIFVVLIILPSFIIGQNKQESVTVKAEDLEHIINQHFKKADSLFNKSDYGLALPQLLKVDSIAKVNDFKNDILINSILLRSDISKLTFTKESTNIAFRLAKRALNISEEIHDQESIHKCYKYLADLSQLIGDMEKTKIYIDKALPYYLSQTGKNPEREESVSRLYLLESAYYNGIKDIENADKSRYLAVEYLEDKNNDPAMAKATYYYGHYLRYYRDDFSKAITYLEKSRELYIKIGDTDQELYHRCLRDLAICYDVFGNIEKSQKYYKEAYNLNVQLTKKANRNTSRRLETKYQAEKKEQEISLLKTENQLAEQKSKNQRNIIIGGLGIASIAGLFLFILFRSRKQTTDKLRQLDSAKSKFFTNISHEFRTPLTLISSPIEELLEDESISDKQRQKFSMAKRNSDRLLSLVNQLLDLSKIDAGKLRLQIQKGNLKQFISALSDSFSYQANKKHINYSVVIKNQDKPEAYFDKDAIEKIVVNLVSNAIKYTPENGTISFKTDVENNILTLEVKNTGIGLAKEELNTIFQRFYQTSEDNMGTGIGLALVKELVDLHKGKIIVDSIPNQWIKFTVTLPVGKNSFKKEQFIDVSSTTLSIEAIEVPNQIIKDLEDDISDNNQPVLLIVEDNSDLRTLIKQTFENQYSIITASNGEEGTTLAIEHIPDIIISDIMMPFKDGIELTKELKNDIRTSHIPIILLTAKAGEENELIGIETGADDYITKPFNSKILVTKASKLLEIREKLQARYSQEITLKPKEVTLSSIDEEFLEKVQTVMDEQLVESSFNIEAFCQGVGMSRMQLHRKIKALTGLSTSEFIRSQRLKLAAELLKKTDVNVSEIGYAVGFNDRSYFTKCFREAFGFAPTTYAKKFAK